MPSAVIDQNRFKSILARNVALPLAIGVVSALVLPGRAGIDPDHKLIDRKPGDNMVEVER